MRELRIAPVMTGGTSLAVWMGGATAELYRLLRCRPEFVARADAVTAARAVAADPDAVPAAVDADDGLAVYRQLLDLTATKPVVDVITGTSAGGLNGVLLAAAIHRGLDSDRYMDTRRTWMEVGDIERLVRSAHEPNPSSLLKGEDYFVPQLERVLKDWKERGRPEGAEVDLVTTLTTVLGVPNSRADDFSEPINQLDHAQTLRFRNADFARDDWPLRLAIAARTSASIPAVFEPSFIPVNTADAKASSRPDFSRNASFPVSRWAVDGGVVVNLPLTEAIERIFDRRAEQEVRRVMLYVCPTPGQGEQLVDDDAKAEPTIKQAAMTAVTAARAEGVAADIDRIRQSNEQVGRQERIRRHLRPFIERPDSLDPDSYRAVRTAASVKQTLAGVRAATVGRLPLDDERVIHELTTARGDLFPDGAVRTPDQPADWKWGIAPVEQALSIALALLARVEMFVDDTQPVDPQLWTLRQDLNAVREVTAGVRSRDEAYWAERFEALRTLDDLGAADLTAWARDSYAQWLGTEARKREAHTQLAVAHRDIATALLRAAPALWAALGRNALPVSALTDSQKGLRSAVRDELTLFVGAEPGPASAGPGQGPVDPDAARVVEVQDRLLAAHVAQTLLLGEVASREQKVELLQVSWNSRNALDPDRLPADKLAGPELARLGAFVKPSWRANDWTWGRMDAAYRLILLLLDPARLRLLAPNNPDLRTELEKLGGGTAALSPEARTELDELFVQPGQKPKPLQAMPALALAIARRVQTAIAQDELPRVALAVEESQHRGSNEFESRIFLDAVTQAKREGALPAEKVPALVGQMRIGTESLRSELGFGLLNRVLGRMSSLAVNALTGTRSGVPALSRLLRPLRIPLQGVNSVIGAVTGASPLARGAAALLMAAAGAIVALRVVGIDTPTGTFAVSAVLLTGLVVGAMFRSGFLYLGTCFLALGTVVGLTLAGPDLVDVVYTAEDQTTVTELGEGAYLTADDGAILQLVTGDDGDRRYYDVPVTADDTEVRLAGEGFELEEPRDAEDDAWKTWGFINTWSVFRVLVGFLVLTLLVGLVRQFAQALRWRKLTKAAGRDVTPWPLVRPVLVALLTVGVAVPVIVQSGPFFEDLLTGPAPVDGVTQDGELLRGTPLDPDDEAEPILVREMDGLEVWKDRAVGFATEAHEYDLEIVLLLFVFVSIFLSLGTDLVSSRFVRRTIRGVRRRVEAGSERLVAIVNADGDPP